MLQGIESQPRSICTRLAGDELSPGALAPNLQLLDGRGPEGIAGRHHHRLPPGSEMLSQFPDGRGFSDPVHADHQDYMRLSGKLQLQRLCDVLQHGGDIMGESLAYLHVGDLFIEACARQIGG